MTLNLNNLHNIGIRLLCFLKIYTNFIIETLNLKYSASIYSANIYTCLREGGNEKA